MESAISNGALLWILVVKESVPVFKASLWTNNLEKLAVVKGYILCFSRIWKRPNAHVTLGHNEVINLNSLEAIQALNADWVAVARSILFGPVQP